MTDLPYTLSEGVQATHEGVRISVNASIAMSAMLAACGHEKISTGLQTLIEWPDVVQVFRYREGEPWCHAETGSAVVICVSPEYADVAPIIRTKLRRLAAIIVDDAEAFRVLHRCIKEFSDG